MFTRVATACLLGALIILFSSTAYAAKPNGGVVLNPDGNFVDIILRQMDQRTFRSTYPADEFPSNSGYVFFESKIDGLWRRDIYGTPDTFNLANALANGGTIILNPGTYYFSARSSWYYEDAWAYTSMDYRPFDAGAKDFVLKGAVSGQSGPAAKVVTDQFLHIGADPLWADGYMYDPSSWHEVRTVSQRFENISFDNTEYLIFRQGRSTTLVGQVGKANVSFDKCKFAGGGLTFHTVGSLVFKENALDQTKYGVELTSLSGSPADADVLIAENTIRSEKTSIRLFRNSQGLSHTPKTMEIVRNDIQVSGIAGIDIDGNLGAPVVLANTIRIVPPRASYVYAGISLYITDAATVKNNVIDSTGSTQAEAGIGVWGSSHVEAKSNKITGAYAAPLLIAPDLYYGSGSSSDFNAFIDNNLRKSSPTGWFGLDCHICLLSGTSNNIVSGSGTAGNHITVLDLGTNNDVE